MKFAFHRDHNTKGLEFYIAISGLELVILRNNTLLALSNSTPNTTEVAGVNPTQVLQALLDATDKFHGPDGTHPPMGPEE